MNKDEVIKYINLCKKANALLYGIDNINKSKQKIYLVFVDNSAGNALKKSAQFLTKKGIDVVNIENLDALLQTDNCKTVAFLNENLAKIIKSKI